MTTPTEPGAEAAAPPPPSIAQLIDNLNLTPLGENRFSAETGQKEGRLFGGLTLAQSIVAASKSVTEGDIHSLHAYFLRAGRPAQPVFYEVTPIRDGRNFTSRRVTARQADDIIFEAMISFVTTEHGIEHQKPMPDKPGPEGLGGWQMGPDAEDLARNPELANPPAAGDHSGPPWRRRGGRGPGFLQPIEMRSPKGGQTRHGDGTLPHRTVWIRPVQTLPDDPIIHAAAIAYASDSGVVGTVAQHYGAWGQTASLDHAMWFHHPPRFDDWLLYTSDSPVGKSARALIHAEMFTQDGTLVVSVSQEGLFRMPKSEGER